MGENYMTIDIGLDTTPGGDVPGEKGSVIDFASLGDERWQGRASGVAGSSYDPKTILDAPAECSDRSCGSVIGGEVTWKMAMSAERSANAIIWADLPVKTTYFATHDAALSMPLRKEMKVKNDISVVTIGSEFSPADCCACCGTHPSSAGQVGLIKIYKVEKNGDWWRVYFDAGMRAMAEYDSMNDTLTDICDRFSTGTPEIGSALDAYMRRDAETHERLARLLKSVVSSRTSEIVSALEDKGDAANQGTVSTALPTWYYDDLEIDDILRIGHDVQTSLGIDPKGKRKEGSHGDAVTALLDKPICLVQVRESTVLLFSNGKTDCGKLVKENASIYQGKGGGSRVSARAIFPGLDQADTFLDLLEKHLR
jgi:alanyl-tRNA synthetase